MARAVREKTVTIANGASLSGAASMRGADLIGVILPAAWTAAALSLQVSDDGTTYTEARLPAGLVAIADPSALGRVSIQPGTIGGAKYVKVRSGTAASPVNQGAARIITLLTSPT